MMGKTALITGASSGIGRDLAGLLAEGGFDLILTARSKPALEETARYCRDRYRVKAEILVVDLADRASPHQIYNDLQARSISIEILINNAGFGTHGKFSNSDLTTELQLLQVNIVAASMLSRLFLPEMLQRGSGRIMNVASLAAFTAGPYMSTYYASKAFLLSHSLALANEARGTGVTVTALCPGPTRTQFQERARINETALFSAGQMDSLGVARAGYRGMMRGKAIVIPGLRNKLLAVTSRFLTPNFTTFIAGQLNRRR
jgi:uncharacterized protein